MIIGGKKMNRFLILLIIFLIGCENESNLKNENNYLFLHSITKCFYPLKHYNDYNYILHLAIDDDLEPTGSNICEYDSLNRVIKESLYDTIQGDPNDNFLVGYKTFEYQDKKVIVHLHDMYQGDPNHNHKIGKAIFYVE